MRTKQPPPADIDAYIAASPSAARERLEHVRATIRKAAPDARERISYRIPTFALCGNLVHFAGFANHVGFYPGAAGVKKFARDLASYASAKGSVQFPHDRPIPLALIAKIVAFRVEQNVAKETAKAQKKKKRKAKRAPR